MTWRNILEVIQMLVRKRRKRVGRASVIGKGVRKPGFGLKCGGVLGRKGQRLGVETGERGRTR